MNYHTNKRGHRVLSLLMAVMMILSLLSTTVLAAQPTAYRDPAEHWMSAGNRTSELDVNAVTTKESFPCYACGQTTSFTVWRTPEYTKDGKSSLTHNVLYSDGTTVDGQNTGSILLGTPGANATYTGYHWTKSCCDVCGTLNSNISTSLYGFGKNVYILYDCAVGFMEDLDETIAYEPADSTYHTKIVDGGDYCQFCFGTNHTHSSSLEKHSFNTKVLAQLDKQRFAIVKKCSVCGYTETEYVAAKCVVANYYGKVDGQAHTLLITDLSESGVRTQIRYGDSADNCTQATPPSYTEEGQYTVYYQVTYTYENTEMTENGVAYVWLHDETAKDPAHGFPGYDPHDHDPNGPSNTVHHTINIDVNSPLHQYTFLDTVPPTCSTLGYDRYLCPICGAIELRNYVQAKEHTYQTVVIREADCEHEGKTLKICHSCGEVKEIITPKVEHHYTITTVPATCTDPGYTVKECSVCGDRVITNITAVKGHTFISTVAAPTCTTGGHTHHVCKDCGESYIDSYTEALGHRWDDGTVIKTPTCNETGLIEYGCLNCGVTKLEELNGDGTSHSILSATFHVNNNVNAGNSGHSYSSDVTAPTCTEMGYTTFTCVDCGDSYKGDYTDPTGHNYKTAVTKPTCTTLGYTTYTCGSCGDSYKSDYVEMLGHNYKAVVTAPTCTEGGYTTFTCSRCGDSYVANYTAALGHDWKKPVKLADSTCNSEGVLEYDCSRCDAHYHEAISAKGHNPGPAATCLNPQTCQDCGAVLAPATGHAYKAVVTKPTCTALGYTTYTCANCGDSYKTEYVEMLGHDYKAEVTAPTCTEGGFTTFTCARCGDSYVANYTDPLGHDWQEPVKLADSTCNSEGVLEYDCSRCDAHYHEAISAKGHKPGPAATCVNPQTCQDCGAVLAPAADHSYQAVVTAPSCTRMGYTTYTCSACGDSYKSDYVELLGHDYTAEVTPPTCTKGGYTTYTCSRCGDSYVDDYIDPLGHAWNEPVTLADSTCNSDGVKLYECSRCDAHYHEAISAKGHKPGSKATCINPQTCQDCGAVLAPATGHRFKAVVTAPTCLDMGYTTYICTACGENYKSDYVKMMGHDYVAEVTLPTCTEGGYTTYTCSRCGDSYVADFTEALGHNWDKGTKIADAACKSEGVLEHHCTRCDEKYLEAISPKGHNPGPAATCTDPQLCQDCGAVLAAPKGHSYQSVVTAPTCTEMGFTTYTCDKCGDSYSADYTNPTGHKSSDWVIDREPTLEQEGFRHKCCLTCGLDLVNETIQKLYRTSTTDNKGEATVNGYLVIVTDTDSKDPITNATVTWNEDGTISIRLPDGRLLDYGDKTTVSVYLAKDKSPVKDITIYITDKNSNYAPDATDENGQVTVPDESGNTGGEGNITFGGKDADADPFTINVIVLDGTNGRPIDGADVTIGKTGTITVVLPDGLDMDPNHPIIIKVLDQNGRPITDRIIVIKGDKDKETGKTDENGTLTVPVTDVTERHGVYILGYPDGTFGPARQMTRAEAAAIFARLLAEKKDDAIPATATTKFADVSANAWYAGYVKYLSNYGVIYGTGNDTFAPDRSITRAEFVAMAVRFFDAYGNGNAKIMEQYAEFTDVSSGYWAAEYIKDAAIHGWIKGYEDGTFRADRNIARCEVVAIVNRLLDRVADQEYVDSNLRTLNTFTDMKKDHWAYYEVMESANAHIAHLNGSETWSK